VPVIRTKLTNLKLSKKCVDSYADVLNYKQRKLLHILATYCVGGCIGSWWGNRRGKDHWGGLGVDGWIILGWISRRWDVGIWTGLGWPRIEIDGGRL